jgi:choline dehydrogenase-like flavoprotein
VTHPHYDIIIIGTGAGGGTLAHRLAKSGKSILVLERGTFLPREKANVNDFYWGEPGFPYPMGQIQLSGKVNRDMLANHVPLAIDADISPDDAARHSVDWWLMGEDLPDGNNRVRLKRERISLEYTDNNTESLYVVDGSFFPSNIGSNPTLTIIENALRVGDHLLDRINNFSV